MFCFPEVAFFALTCVFYGYMYLFHWNMVTNLSMHCLIPHIYVITCDKSDSLVKQELLTFPEHPNSPPIFSGGRVAQSLVSCFIDHCLYFCPLFIRSLHFLSFFDLRLMITTLISSKLALLFFFSYPLFCLPFLDLSLLITLLIFSK